MSYNTIIFDENDAPAIANHFDSWDRDHTNGYGDYLIDLVSHFGDYEKEFECGDITKEEFEEIEQSIEFFAKDEDAHYTFSC